MPQRHSPSGRINDDLTVGVDTLDDIRTLSPGDRPKFINVGTLGTYRYVRDLWDHETDPNPDDDSSTSLSVVPDEFNDDGYVMTDEFVPDQSAAVVVDSGVGRRVQRSVDVTLTATATTHSFNDSTGINGATVINANVATSVIGKLQFLNTSALNCDRVLVTVQFAAGSTFICYNAAGGVLVNDYSTSTNSHEYIFEFVDNSWVLKPPGAISRSSEEAKASRIPIASPVLVCPFTATKRNLGGSAAATEFTDVSGTTQTDANGTVFDTDSSNIDLGSTLTAFTLSWRSRHPSTTGTRWSIVLGLTTAADNSSGVGFRRGTSFLELGCLGGSTATMPAVGNTSEHTITIIQVSASERYLYVDGVLIASDTNVTTLGQFLRIGGVTGSTTPVAMRNLILYSGAKNSAEQRLIEAWVEDLEMAAPRIRSNRDELKAREAQVIFPGAVAILPLRDSLRNFGSADGELNITSGSPTFTGAGLFFDGVDDSASLTLTASTPSTEYVCFRAAILSAHATEPYAIRVWNTIFGRDASTSKFQLTVSGGNVDSSGADDALEHTFEIIQTSNTARSFYIDGVLAGTNTTDNSAGGGLTLLLGKSGTYFNSIVARNVVASTTVPSDYTRVKLRAWAEDRDLLCARVAQPAELNAVVNLPSGSLTAAAVYLPKNLSPSATYLITLQLDVNAAYLTAPTTHHWTARSISTFYLTTDAAGAISAIAETAAGSSTPIDSYTNITTRTIGRTYSTSTGVTLNLTQANAAAYALSAAVQAVEITRYRVK